MNKERKRKKDPGYQLANTGAWVVSSSEAKRILAKLEKKRARKEAWLKKVQKNN